MGTDSGRDDIFESPSEETNELFSDAAQEQPQAEASERQADERRRGAESGSPPEETDREGAVAGGEHATAREATEPPTAPDEPQTDEVSMDWAQAVHAPRVLQKGEIVEGTVVAIDDETVIVDVGAKQDGLIPRAEFPTEGELPEIESKLEVAVMRVDDEDADGIRLSKRRADYINLWNELEEKAGSGGIVEAMVTDRVKGGLRADVGVPAFVPASHVATRNIRNLDKFVGRSLRFKVLEADRKDKNVVLSHRELVEEEREKRRRETLSKLYEGAIVEGKVRNLTDYGAFVDLGGIDGLLHISEMSWTRIDHPSDVLKVGETIRVVVLSIEEGGDRISLGRRQILPDPWKETAAELQPGTIVKAKITRIVRTGAFAQLKEAGIEGFIPIREMSEKRIGDPTEVLSEGQEVDLKIQQIRLKARRMTLSLIAAAQEKERREYEEYMDQQQMDAPTLGDQFGDVLASVKDDVGEEGAEEEKEQAGLEEEPEGTEEAAEHAEAEEAEEAAEAAEGEAEPEADEDEQDVVEEEQEAEEEEEAEEQDEAEEEEAEAAEQAAEEGEAREVEEDADEAASEAEEETEDETEEEQEADEEREGDAPETEEQSDAEEEAADRDEDDGPEC